MTRIPVTVLTGFLGAGKTTVLNRLLAGPGLERTAVIVNEFGEAGIDGGLVTEADARAFAMSTGCLCCTVSGDVRLTLLRLLDEAERGVGPEFDRVIVETTGLADPAPVLQTFMTNDMILELFALNGVVTVVDCILGDEALDRFEEARRQAGVADVLLLSKTDMARDPASLRDVAALRARLAALNPNARVMEAGEATAETVLSLAAFDPAGRPPDVAAWLRFGDAHDHDHHHDHGHDHGHGHHHHDVNRHGDAVSAFCYGATAPLDPGALEDAIGALRASLGRDLLRLKGIVALAGHEDAPAVVHAVGHIANPPRLLPGWPPGMTDTRLVVIAAGPGREAVDGLLTRFLPELVRTGG